MSNSRKRRRTVSRLSPGSIMEMRRLRAEGSSIAGIGSVFGVSKSIVFYHVKDVEVRAEERERDNTVADDEVHTTQSIDIKQSTLQLLQSAAQMRGQTIDEAVASTIGKIRDEKQSTSQSGDIDSFAEVEN